LSTRGSGAAFPPGPGAKPMHVAPATASADQIGQPDAPTLELTTDGALLDAQPSADGELASIVAPLRELVRLPLADEPRAEDHVCTPADFVVGPVARFEANLAALALLKTLAAEGRPVTPDERAVLARFSGFGDSTFEPAFRVRLISQLAGHRDGVVRPPEQPLFEPARRFATRFWRQPQIPNRPALARPRPVL